MQNIILKKYAINFPIYRLTIYSSVEYIVVISCKKTWIKLRRKQIAILFHFETWSHSILLALFRFHLVYHSLSFTVIHCHLLSLFVTCCTTRCHSFSLVVPLAFTFCHSLLLDVPLVCIFINNRNIS